MLADAVVQREADASISANVATLFAEQASRRPSQAAIVDRHRGVDRATTFAALDDRGARLAGLLRAAGVEQGDVILLGLRPGLDLYASILAVMRIGAVAMLVEPGAGRKVLVDACQMVCPRAVLASGSVLLRGLALRAVRDIPIRLTTSPWFPTARSVRPLAAIVADRRVAMVDAHTPAILTFTSGSTGQPKAAIRTHAILDAQHRALRAVAANDADVDLVSMPVVVLANLAAGATSIIADVSSGKLATATLDGIRGQIARLAPTRLTVSPILVERLALEAGVLALGRVRRIVTGGGPLFPDVTEQVRNVAPAADVISVYGSTEAEPIAHLSAGLVSECDRRQMGRGAGLLAGRPVSEVRLRILRAPAPPWFNITSRQLDEATVPVGEIGEITVAGDHVVAAYLHSQGDAETKLHVAGTVWHRTGDAGYIDALGRLWLLGRMSAVIHDRHGSAHPFAIECGARSIIGHRRMALTAHESARTLVVEGSLSVSDLHRLERGLAWAHLDRIHTVRKLPMDHRHASKVDYPALAALLRRTLRSSLVGAR